MLHRFCKCSDTTQRKAVRTGIGIHTGIGRVNIDISGTGTRNRIRPEVSAGTDARRAPRTVVPISRRREEISPKQICKRLDTTHAESMSTTACSAQAGIIADKPGTPDIGFGSSRARKIPVGTDVRQRSRKAIAKTRRREEIPSKQTCKRLDTMQQSTVGTVAAGIQEHIRETNPQVTGISPGRKRTPELPLRTDSGQRSRRIVQVPRRRDARIAATENSGMVRKPNQADRLSWKSRKETSGLLNLPSHFRRP